MTPRARRSGRFLCTATLSIGSILAATAASARPPSSDFPLITYRLPETNVAARLILSLESCGVEGPKFSGELSLVAKASPSVQSFSLTPYDLESARVKRSLAVTLHENGTIATINSSAEDRTGAILGNILRFVGTIVGAVIGAPAFRSAEGSTPGTLCNERTMVALARVSAIDTRIVKLRKQPIPADPARYRALARMIDGLAAERGQLREGPLRIELEADLPLDDLAKPGAVQPVQTPFAAAAVKRAWLTETAPVPPIALEWSAVIPAGAYLDPGQSPAARCSAGQPAPTQKVRSLCFAEPVSVAFTASVLVNKVRQPGTAQETFPIAQWGALRQLDLGAGFGSKKTVSLTLDAFGRPSQMSWASEARAEAVTGTVADLAAQAAGIVTANSGVARDKAEIEALTARQTLNRLRACRQILDAGGSACPAEAPNPPPTTTSAPDQ